MDATKRCCTCHEALPRSEFNRRAAASDGLQSRCRSCAREWYVANGERHRSNVRRRTAAVRREYKRRVGEHLQGHPCVDCGEADVRVLEFDHVGDEDKRDDVVALVAAGGRWSDIAAEIDKCVVRCANCHRRITSARAQDWRFRLASVLHDAAAEAAARRLSALLPAAAVPPVHTGGTVPPCPPTRRAP